MDWLTPLRDWQEASASCGACGLDRDSRDLLKPRLLHDQNKQSITDSTSAGCLQGEWIGSRLNGGGTSITAAPIYAAKQHQRNDASQNRLPHTCPLQRRNCQRRYQKHQKPFDFS